MTNRTREIFEFAQLEPLAVGDIAMMLKDCSEDEVGDVKQVSDSLAKAIRDLDKFDIGFFDS